MNFIKKKYIYIMNKKYFFPSFFSRENEYVGFSMYRKRRNIGFKRILLNSTKNRDLEGKKINEGEENCPSEKFSNILNSTNFLRYVENPNTKVENLNPSNVDLTSLKKEHISLKEAFRIFSAKGKDSITVHNDTSSILKPEKLPKESNTVHSGEKLSPVFLSSLDVTLPKKQTPSMKKTEYKLETFQRSNQDTCLSHKPAVSEGDWVQSGDLLTDCANSVGGDLSLGQNIFIAYMPWEGYNFEDAILISDRLVSEDIFTSVHIERYEIENIQKNGVSQQERSTNTNKEINEKSKRKEKNLPLERNKKEKISIPQTTGFEEITRDIPDVTPEEVSHLDSFGIVKIGSFIEEGDILVGKITPINKKDFTPYQKLLYTILDKQIRPYRDSSLRAPKGIKAKVIDIKIFVKPKKLFPGISSTKENFPKGKFSREGRATETNFSLIPSLRNYINTKRVRSLSRSEKNLESLLSPSQAKRKKIKNSKPRSEAAGGPGIKNSRFLQEFKGNQRFLLNPMFRLRRNIKTQDPNSSNSFPSDVLSPLWKKKPLRKKNEVFFPTKHRRKINKKFIQNKDSGGRLPLKGNFLSYLKQKRNSSLSLNLQRGNLQSTLGLHTNKSFTRINKMRNILLQGLKPQHSLYSILGVNTTNRAGEKFKKLDGFFSKGRPYGLTGDEKTASRAHNKLSLKKFPQFSQLLSYSRKFKKGPHLVRTLQKIINGQLKSFKIMKKLKKEIFCLNNSSLFSHSNKSAGEKIFYQGAPCQRHGVREIFQARSGMQNFYSTKSIKDIETIHIYLAEKRKIQVGDKMSGRHGNKGIVSQILPMQDMPFLPDGTPIDMVLNPLGVPSRMNVGQIYECLLGLAGKYLGEHYRISSFDEIYGPEASRSFVFHKLYEARRKTGFKWLFNPEYPGKVRIYDGRSGDCYHQPVTVGQAYMLRLVHMVDDKIHMRSTGPYSLVTQQPLRGRSKQGGQRLGEMEVWALEGYGAAFTLLEMLTVKSDDLTGRMTLWSNLILNKDLTIGTPEAFKVLICELQALCLDIGLFRYNTTNTSPLREDLSKNPSNFSDKSDFMNSETQSQLELRTFQQKKSLTEMTSLMSFP